MSTGYLKGVVASVYTSHFNAYASFEVLTEPQKMFLAVEYMNGITLTFGDSLPKHELVFIAGIFDSHRDFQVVPSSFLCLDPPTLLKWLCETKNCGPETQPNAETWALVPFNSFLDAIGGGDKVDPNDLLITSCFTDTNQFRHALAAFTLHFTKLKEEKDPAYNHIFFAPKAQLDGHGSSTANTSAVDPSSHQNASNSKQCSKFDDEDVSPAQSEDETKKNDDIFELSDSSGSEEDENEVGGDSLLGNLGKRKRKPRSKAALLASLEEQGLAYRSSGRVLAQNGAIEKGLGSSASGSGQPLGENPKPNLKPPPKKPPPKKPTPKQDEVDLMSRTQLDEVAILYGMTRKELRAIKVEQLRPIVRKFKLKKPPQKTPSSPPPPPPPPPPTLPLVKPVAKTVLPSEPAQVTTTSLPKPTLEVSNDKLPALHSGFMNQQQSQLDFQVKVLDVALNFAERYNNR
jgi:hypothetical protein